MKTSPPARRVRRSCTPCALGWPSARRRMCRRLSAGSSRSISMSSACRPTPVAPCSSTATIASANSGIDQRRAGELGQQQRHDHGQVHQEVGAVVQAVGADRDRAGAPHHGALQQHQRAGQRDREHHHRDAEAALADRLRRDQPLDALRREDQRRADDEARLGEGAERLGLAVAVAMGAIGRLGGLTHADEGHERGQKVDAAVDQRGQHRDRIGDQPGAELGERQRGGDRDAGEGGAPVEGARLGGGRFGHRAGSSLRSSRPT